MRRAVRLIGKAGRQGQQGQQAPRLGAGPSRCDAPADASPSRGLTARELIEMARSARAAMQQRRP